jgi:hypothetical protein
LQAAQADQVVVALIPEMALIVVLELMAVSVSVVKVILVDQAFVLTQTLKTHTVADQVAAPGEEVQVLQMDVKLDEAALETTW